MEFKVCSESNLALFGHAGWLAGWKWIWGKGDHWPWGIVRYLRQHTVENSLTFVADLECNFNKGKTDLTIVFAATMLTVTSRSKLIWQKQIQSLLPEHSSLLISFYFPVHRQAEVQVVGWLNQSVMTRESQWTSAQISGTLPNPTGPFTYNCAMWPPIKETTPCLLHYTAGTYWIVGLAVGCTYWLECQDLLWNMFHCGPICMPVGVIMCSITVTKALSRVLFWPNSSSVNTSRLCFAFPTTHQWWRVAVCQ